MKNQWHRIDIVDPSLYSEAWELARELAGEDNIGYNAMSGWIAVKDDTLAVQLKLTYG